MAGGACGSEPEGATAGRAPSGHATRATVVDASKADVREPDAREPGAPEADARGTEAGCARGSMPLLILPVSDEPGAAPYKLFVPAKTDGQSVAFLLDTGSPLTFLHELLRDGGSSTGNPVMPDAGSAVVGCDQLSLVGAPVAPDPPIDGLTVAGTLGDEHLLARPLRLDFGAAQVLWNDPGVPFAGTESWPSAGFDRPFGYVRIHDVSFDGTPVQMFVDTGAADSVWLGQQGKPGDVEVDGEDSEGNTIRMYLGTATLAIGPHEETVPVYRVPSFPYLQQAVSALDGKLNGLFGLSSFARGIVFDTDANVVRIAP